MKKINKTAIISVILSTISFFVFGWLGIIGFSLGICSLKEIKQKNEKGKMLAIIGSIGGIISFALYIYLINFIL